MQVNTFFSGLQVFLKEFWLLCFRTYLDWRIVVFSDETDCPSCEGCLKGIDCINVQHGEARGFA